MKIISTLLLVFLITITNATETKSEFKIDEYKFPTSDNIFAQMKTSSSLKAKTSLRAGSNLEVKTAQAPYPYYHIVARHSNLCMTLDIVGGVNINQNGCANVANQKYMVSLYY
jgi:hypothetical protein